MTDIPAMGAPGAADRKWGASPPAQATSADKLSCVQSAW